MRSEPYLTAQLLQAIHGCASGDRKLFNYSRDLRSALVRNAKQAGLFQEPTQPQCSLDDDAASTESRWMAWIAAERQRRLGWAIYVSPGALCMLRYRQLVTEYDLPGTRRDRWYPSQRETNIQYW